MTLFRNAASPLRIKTFRRIWIASLFANLGQQIQIVAVAWSMVTLAAAAPLVGLVQTAAMLPVMLLALPAGAMADLYDRRKLAILGLFICASGTLLLLGASLSGLMTPHMLLLGCFVSGIGVALLSPSWQSSVAEQVGPDALPTAVALYGVSANLGRCVGPALGGLLIAALSQWATFAINATFYLPMIVALLLWRRAPATPIEPRQTISGAIRGGLHYLATTRFPRTIVLRGYLAAIGSVACLALGPLIAAQQLNVGAHRFGLLLAAFGAGGASALFVINALRQRWTSQLNITICSAALSLALFTLALSRSFPVSALAMGISGMAWMITMSVLNLEIQLSVPAWVTGRTLAMFSASVAFGLATGGAIWGMAAERVGLPGALCLAGTYLVFTLAVGHILPIANDSFRKEDRALPPGNLRE